MIKSYAGLVICWFVLWAATVQAQCPSGTEPGGDFCYTISNEKLTIEGYTGPGGDITIPDTIDGKPVKIIGTMAFRDCTTLTSVTIPDSVTIIDFNAFENCTNLRSVDIPDSVTYIGDLCFL